MTYELDGIIYNVIITYKWNKNIYVRVKEDGNIYVSCTRLISKNQIKKLLEANESFLRKSLLKIEAKKKKKEEYRFLGEKIKIIISEETKQYEFDSETLIVHDESKIDKFYKDKALIIFRRQLNEIYSKFEEKIPFPNLRIRQMKTRWGVCNRKNNTVTLNLELIKYSYEEINYVIVHELSHFIEFNHSKNFWNVVKKYCPDYSKIRKKLNY